jgi:transposase-like protein
LQNPVFQDETLAREWLEARVWPNGPHCPHCGNADKSKITSLKGKAHRAGLYQCNECREQFTVTVGTVFERSKIPLTKWLAVLFLLTSSKKGISTHQLHRMIGVSYKSTWFMTHRIRQAMRSDGTVPIGSGSGSVEVDETYFGKVGNPEPSPHRRGRPYTKSGKSGPSGKRAVLALVERGGNVRMFHLTSPDKVTVEKIVRGNIAKEAKLYTDESKLYTGSDEHFASHETVTHSRKEYVRGDVHTNTVEGAFSIFKRGMKGVYQHCAEKHLHRYLAEFEFRYNTRVALGVNDVTRAELAAQGIVGKRLTYRMPDGARMAL